MKNPPILFLDCETLGLDLAAPIWEVAAIRVGDTGMVEDVLTMFVEHDPADWVQTLPASFQDDYERRYSADQAKTEAKVVRALAMMITPGTVVAGSNPSFDMQRLEPIAEKHSMTLPWHYRPEDIPTLARGWLYGRGVYPAPPWKSDFISQACGVDPRDYDRHTALGDCEWALALWRAVSS